MPSVPPAGPSGISSLLPGLGQELGLPTQTSGTNAVEGSVGDSAVFLEVIDKVSQDDAATQRGSIVAASLTFKNLTDSAIASALAAQKLVADNIDLENNKIPAAQQQLQNDQKLYDQAKAAGDTKDEKKYCEAVKSDEANLSQLNGEVKTNTQEIDSLQESLSSQVEQLVQTAGKVSTLKPSSDAGNQSLDLLLNQLARIGKDFNTAINSLGVQGIEQAQQETAAKLSHFLEAAKKAKSELAKLLGPSGKTLPVSSLTTGTNSNVPSRLIIPV